MFCKGLKLKNYKYEGHKKCIIERRLTRDVFGFTKFSLVQENDLGKCKCELTAWGHEFSTYELMIKSPNHAIMVRLNKIFHKFLFFHHAIWYNQRLNPLLEVY